MIRLLNTTCDTPAENIALEEALLDSVAQGRAPDTLRLWESATPFVVLGTAQALAEHVREAHCKADGVPIMRRCTAGGCVLQGPGCLNFSLLLSYANYPQLHALHASYRFILGSIAGELAGLGITLEPMGISDLARDGKKVSGSAQRRKKDAMLHHGTLLHQLDPKKMARYLKEPSERPEYRLARIHQEFLAALPLPRGILEAAVCSAFGAVGVSEAPTAWELDRMGNLVSCKYARNTWIHRR